MSNTIKLSIDTDASYNADEKINLLDAFLAFMNEADADVLDGTESIDIVAEGTATNNVSDEQKQEIIAEFVANAKVEYQVQARFCDEDGKQIGSVVTARGDLA